MTDITPAALDALLRGDLENFTVASTPSGIEAQEARGQRDLVASTNLPVDSRDSKEEFEALGIHLGSPIDELFQQAVLPDGWKKEASDHSMWSYVVDETGKKRIAIFYKAAFYDRRAFMSIIKEEK